MLSPVVFEFRVLAPIAVLFDAVVFANKEFLIPIATLLLPVVLFVNALVPTAVLL